MIQDLRNYGQESLGINTVLVLTQFNDSQTSSIAAGYGNSGALFLNQPRLHENGVEKEKIQRIIHANNHGITALACGPTDDVIGV